MEPNRSISPRHRRRPSAALVVACVALVVALGGTATAASYVIVKSSKQIKNGVIQKADLSKSARKSLAGQAGKTGPAGKAGTNGTNGAAGKPGQDGSAVAYARVTKTGDVTNTRSIVAANVAIGNSDGQFCFRDLGFVPHNIQAQIAYLGSGTAGMTIQAELGAPAGNVCPEHTVAFIKTYDHLGGQTGEPFFVTFN